MPLITKPDFTYVWASGGAVVAPNDTKKQLGWVAEAPPFQYDNWLQNRQDQMLAHINQRGIPAWDGLTNYEAAGLSYVQGSNGVVYKSVAASGPSTTVQDPTTDVSDTYWTVAFASTTQASETVQGIVELATTAEAQTGTDDVRAMTALKVKQAIEQFSAGDLLNRAVATVAAAGTINLTTGAPDTSQIAISGTGVSINGFTVAANRFFVVKMTGASNTLINSASLVTGRGANIPVVAGDCFLMRSTAANTVEIVGFVENPTPRASLATNGWQRLPSGLIIQWGTVTSIAQETGVTVSLPIAFPNSALGGSATIKSASPLSGGVNSAYLSFPSASQVRVVNDVGAAATLDIFYIAFGH